MGMKFDETSDLAQWLSESTGGEGLLLGTWMPSGFERYTRVLCPFQSDDDFRDIRWSELAARFGLRLTGETLADEIWSAALRLGATDFHYQGEGASDELWKLLIELLVDGDQQPPAFYYGTYSWKCESFESDFQVFTLPYLSGELEVVKAPLSDFDRLAYPSLWFPLDRSWLYLSISDTTGEAFIASNQKTAESLLGSTALDAFEIDLNFRVRCWDDTYFDEV
jgi:hypothetical protein